MDCFYKDTCKKYIVDKTVDGVSCDKDSCIKFRKTDTLCSKALLSDKQKYPIMLDPELVDKEKYCKLRDGWERDIINKVANGNCLYIHSQYCGNGKTTWAVKLLRAYINKIWYTSDLTCRALFVHVPKFLQAVKDNISHKSEYAEYVKKNALAADLVVWDDIATKTMTPFEGELLLSILDERINSGKSNIFTSNLSESELARSIDGRLYSRIVSISENIEFNGGDRRELIKK